VVEELSKIDGSVGWCAMIATALSDERRPVAGGGRAGTGGHAGRLPRRRLGACGWACVGGRGWLSRQRAMELRQRYPERELALLHLRHDGRRHAASGSRSARGVGAQGIGDHRGYLVGDGNAGTGSQDFTVDDVFVPAARSCLSEDPPCETGPLFNQRAWYVHVWTPSAANALGVARGAIDSLAEIAATEASTLSTHLLRDRPMVQARIGEAEAIVNAARPMCSMPSAGCGTRCVPGRLPRIGEIAQARLALVHAMHESVPRGGQSVSRGGNQRDLHAPAAGAGIS